MIYDLDNELDREKYKARVNHLFKNRKKVEMKEKKELRSLPQNRYLHVMLSYAALHTGYTEQQMKHDIWKKIICRDIFLDKEKSIECYRSSAKLSTLEMTQAIDMFRDFWSVQIGLYIPSPDDHLLALQAETEIEQYGNREHLQANIS